MWQNVLHIIHNVLTMNETNDDFKIVKDLQVAYQ